MEIKETNEKTYYSQSLERMLSKYITREGYGDFTNILREIFHRRSYEFNFSEEQIEREVANFVKNVKNIGFVPKEEMSSPTAMGVYMPQTSEIKINQDHYLRYVNSLSEETFGSQLFETLTHEVYHAITDIKSELGLMYYKNGEWRGAALNEVFTETAANRTCISRGAIEAEQYRADTDGYPDITFFSNLLAASIGVSEKEILQGGTQNRKQLMEVIASKFPKGRPYNEAQKLFDKLEASLDTVYNARYKNVAQTEDEKNVQEQILSGALSTMYQTAFELASHQIQNDNQEITSESLADITYRYSKMEKIMIDSATTFESWGAISPESKQRIFLNTGKSREALASKVVGFDTLVRQGNKITSKTDLETSIKLAKRGILPQKSHILSQRYGISISKVTPLSVYEITDNLQHDEYVMREDFDNGRQWNNIDVAIVIKRAFISDMEKKGLLYKPSAIELQETEELPIIDPDKTEELPVIDPDKTEELPVIDPDKTEELPVVDPDKTEELPVVDGELKKKGFFTKLNDYINTIVTRFKNRNQPKLPQGKETKHDNSEYYASLATQSLESSLDKYIVGPQPKLKIEDIRVSNESKQNEIIQEDEER